MSSKHSDSTPPIQTSLPDSDDSCYNLPVPNPVVGETHIAIANTSVAQDMAHYSPSPAINAGVDAIMNMMASEINRQRMSLLAQMEADNALVNRDAKRRVDAVMTQIEGVRAEAYAQVQKLQETLSLESRLKDDTQRKLQHAIAREHQIAHELRMLRSENEQLRAALASMGVEYTVSESNDGRVDSQHLELRFDARTACIVDNFARGVNGTLREVLFSSPTRPVEFFSALEATLDKKCLWVQR